jgi:hypothetical protein
VKTTAKRILTSLLSLPIFFSQISCTHVQRRFDHDLSQARCEDALEHLPEHDRTLHVLDQAQTVAGTAVSYSASGIAYAGDVLLTITGGTLIFVALCGPMIALATASSGQSGSSPGLTCIPADLSAVKLPHFGKDTFDSTRSWRCPDLSSASTAIRGVADCFAARADHESLQKAKTTLESIAQSSQFSACVAEPEKSHVSGDLKALEEKIALESLSKQNQ